MFETLLAVNSLLPWVAAVGVQALALHVGFSSLREAQRSAERAARPVWAVSSSRWLLLQAALALATGQSAAMVLGLPGQAETAQLHFGLLELLLLTVLAIVVMLPALLLLTRRQDNQSVLPVAAGLALAALVVDMGWLHAAGTGPGPEWHALVLALAGLTMCLGLASTLRLAYVGAGRRGSDRKRWRLAAATMGAFCLVFGESLVLAAAEFPQSSLAPVVAEVPTRVLAVVAGVCAPLLLVLMWGLLLVRRQLAQPDPRARRDRRDLRDGRNGRSDRRTADRVAGHNQG